LAVRVYSSPDGLHDDTAEVARLDVDLRPGQTAQKTIPIPVAGRFLRATLNNPGHQPCRNVRVVVTLQGP
jgi:hypothetical protein